jgi:uncharacterized protein
MEAKPCNSALKITSLVRMTMFINFQIIFFLAMRNLKGAKLPLFFLVVLLFLLQGSLIQAQTASDGESVSIPEAPNPPKLFNDYVGVVSASDAAELEAMMVRMNDSTTVQIAVVIVSTVGQYDISDYSQQLATKWGIGQKGKNNGVLLVLAMNDRKSRIEVGYGLEGVITDIQTAQIQDRVLKPLMKQKQYAAAISETVSALYQAAKGEYKAVAPPTKSYKKNGKVGIFVILIVIAIIFLLSRGNKGGKGGRGGGIGDLILPAILLSNMGRGGGGSSWGGGSSSGGSFGGFGGGSFGGGGSSGDW